MTDPATPPEPALTPAIALAALDRLWPDAACELQARDPWEFVVAAILSARTHDLQVNRVMAHLAEHFVSVSAFATLDHRELDKALRTLPLHAQKARAIVEAARAILRHHGGVVPADREALTKLPGVGPKTAAVVLGNAFGIPAIAADVHVQRVLHRWGWAFRDDPRDAVIAAESRLPEERWVRFCHQVIRLGRAHCRRIARCDGCPLEANCPKVNVG